MMRKGALLFALAAVLLTLSLSVSFSQNSGSPNVLADMKISYPTVSHRMDVKSFIVNTSQDLKVLLNLPVLTGSHKGWIGIINALTKEEIWGTMIDASKGPQKIAETKSFKPGTYKMIVEYSEDITSGAKAKWSGTLTVSR